jgi:hypothetical protein
METYMQLLQLTRVLTVVLLAAALSACGGNPSGTAEVVQGVSTPGSVSMVSAKNAE